MANPAGRSAVTGRSNDVRREMRQGHESMTRRTGSTRYMGKVQDFHVEVQTVEPDALGDHRPQRPRPRRSIDAAVLRTERGDG